MSSATACPLTWPPTIPRALRREAGQFKTTLAAAKIRGRFSRLNGVPS